MRRGKSLYQLGKAGDRQKKNNINFELVLHISERFKIFKKTNTSNALSR